VAKADLLGWPIVGFVGANGAGKTLGMVELLALPSWRRGRPVVANFALEPERAGFPADLYQPLRTWQDVTKLRECTLLVDEISATFPSRQSAAMPAQLGRMLNQLRKPDVTLGWSGPAWARCDKLLRECTQLAVVCRGFLGTVEPGKSWRSNRVFSYWGYDARDYDTFDQSTHQQKHRPVVKRWYRRKSGIAHELYDTREQVMLLSHLASGGTCMECGGERARPRCECDNEAPHERTARSTASRNGTRRAVTA
jgi:hypothetical protein